MPANSLLRAKAGGCGDTGTTCLTSVEGRKDHQQDGTGFVISSNGMS